MGTADLPAGASWRRLLLSVLAVTATLAFTGAASAQARWQLNAGGNVCVLTLLNQELAAGISRVAASQPCSGGLDRIAGYSVERNNHTIMVYTYDGGYTQMLGRFDFEREGYYVGMIGDGDPATLTRVAQGAQAPAMQQSCVTYYNTSQCAGQQDLGIPNSSDQFAYEAWLQPVVNLNLRMYPGLQGAKAGTIEPQICVQAGECRSIEDGSIWCSIPFGGLQAWFLKQDRQHVYARTPQACG